MGAATAALGGPGLLEITEAEVLKCQEGISAQELGTGSQPCSMALGSRTCLQCTLVTSPVAARSY